MTTVFYLPAKEVDAPSVYVAGVLTGVVLTAGAGPEGEDQITFAAAPANGAAITFTSAGARSRYSVWYLAEKGFVPSHFEADLWKLDVQLIEDVS
ncbi:MAG: hypothetical protein WBX15_20310 [Thermoanaerobaculia bacterium]